MADVTPDPLPAALSDSDWIPGDVLVYGYLGDGPEDTVRIYPEPDLVEYIEVPAAAVHHRHKIEDDDVFAAHSAVWIDGALMREPFDPSPGLIHEVAGGATRGHTTLLELSKAIGLETVASGSNSYKCSKKYCREDELAAV
jgi:hypothetical protein